MKPIIINQKQSKMRTVKTTANLFMLTILALLFITSCSNDDDNSAIPTPSNMVNVGNYKLFTESIGEGNHTLVFESGLGDNYESWYQLLGLSEGNQVIAYNRAGYEPSEVAHNERDISQLAEDLHQVILSKATNERVILVGHSLGGAVIRYYAVLHPEMVEALVFVDPSHEDYGVFTQEIEDDMVAYFKGEGLFHIANEAKQMLENFEILRELPNLPDVPTVVLTSVKERIGADKMDWITAHETLGEGLSVFTHIITENSGHYIQVEEPQLVIDAIANLF